MNIDEINVHVTEAIRRAEMLQDLAAPGASAAFLDLSLIEEALAQQLPSSTVEGAIARRGAVRAAIAGGHVARARQLVERFTSEEGIPERLVNELKGVVGDGAIDNFMLGFEDDLQQLDRERLIRVVLDTNIYVLAVVDQHPVPSELDDLALGRQYTHLSSLALAVIAQGIRDQAGLRLSLYASRRILLSVVHVLKRSLGWADEPIKEYLRLIRDLATRSGGAILEVGTPLTFQEGLDPNDFHLLALAAEASADLVVTADLDLIAVSPWRGMPVVNPERFALRALSARRHQAQEQQHGASSAQAASDENWNRRFTVIKGQGAELAGQAGLQPSDVVAVMRRRPANLSHTDAMEAEAILGEAI